MTEQRTSMIEVKDGDHDEVTGVGQVDEAMKILLETRLQASQLHLCETLLELLAKLKLTNM